MISPVLVEKFALPLLDWTSAIAEAIGHAVQGTLCADPVPSRASDTE